MKDMDLKTNIKKSILASCMIAIGIYCLLHTSNSLISMILFSFGLYSICMLQLNLFTGKCGYVKEIPIDKILIMLFTNIITSYVIGLIFSIDENIYVAAHEKLLLWEKDLWVLTIIKSIFCGIIMFVAVDIFNQAKNPCGIFFGIPLFLICGFYHSLANITILGCTRTFDIIKIFIWIAGNWIGSYFVYALTRN